MIINYPKTILHKENTQLNHCIYLNDHNTLYKDSTASFSCPRNLSERIVFVSEMGQIEGLIGPINILSDNNEIYGYESEYLKNYSTLKSLIDSGDIVNLSFEQKKLILLKLFQSLRKINESFEFGDINLSNIMIGDNDGKFVDFDNGRPLDSDFIQMCKYHFFPLTKTESDSFKLLIDALCMIYNTDFEFYLSKYYGDELPAYLNYHHFDKSIISFVIEFNKAVKSHSSTLYFDECLSSIRNISNKSIREVQDSFSRG